MTLNEASRELKNLLSIGQNNRFEFGQRINALQAIEKKYSSLSKTDKQKFKIFLYLSYREQASLYFTTNRNCRECNYYFEKSFSIVHDGDFDSDINICISKSMYCKSLILSGLKNKSQKDIEKSKEYLNSIQQVIRDYGRPDVIDDITKTQMILNDIELGNVWTLVKFQIPYLIELQENKEYEFTYKEIKRKVISVRKETAQNSLNLNIDAENGYVFNKNDKYGLLNRSEISIYINAYIEPEEKVNINCELKDVWLSVAEAIETWNYFLRVFKVATKEYWLDNINEFMILNYSTEIFAGTISLRNIPVSFSMGLIFNNELPRLSEEQETQLQKLLIDDEIQLWETAYLDAMNNLQVRNYKESIVQINIALENFLYQYAIELLSKNIGFLEAEKFLTGEIKYDDFYLNQYITKSDFEKLVKEEIIKNNPPNTYGIIKKCSAYWDANISKRAVTKKISSIRLHRNDIVHGINVKCNYKSVCENAITNFNDLRLLLHPDMEQSV